MPVPPTWPPPAPSLLPSPTTAPALLKPHLGQEAQSSCWIQLLPGHAAAVTRAAAPAPALAPWLGRDWNQHVLCALGSRLMWGPIWSLSCNKKVSGAGGRGAGNRGQVVAGSRDSGEGEEQKLQGTGRGSSHSSNPNLDLGFSVRAAALYPAFTPITYGAFPPSPCWLGEKPYLAFE